MTKQHRTAVLELGHSKNVSKLSQERLSQYFFLILLFLIIWLAYNVLEIFLTSILLSIILTYYFYPVYKSILQGVKNRSVAALIMIFLILLIVVPPAAYVLLKLGNEAFIAFQTLNLHYGWTKDFVFKFIESHIPLGELMTQLGTQFVDFTKANAQKIISSVSNAILQLFIFFFVMYYCFKDGPSFFERVQEILPLRNHQKKILTKELSQMIHAVIHGQFTTALLQGIIGGIALWLFGIPNPIFLGFLMFLLSFLPVIGSALVWIPSALWLMLQNHLYTGIGLLAFGFIILTNIDNLVRPKLIHNSTNLHPVLVFLGVLGGLAAFGFSGILLGPIVLLMFTVLVRFYIQGDY